MVIKSLGVNIDQSNFSLNNPVSTYIYATSAEHQKLFVWRLTAHLQHLQHRVTINTNITITNIKQQLTTN